MDKFELIQSQITAKHKEQEELELSYHLKERQREEDFYELENRFRKVQGLIEEKFDFALSYMRQNDLVPGEEFEIFKNNLQLCLEEAESSFREELARYDELAEKEDADFRKQSRLIDDQLEELYRERSRAMYEEEKQNGNASSKW